VIALIVAIGTMTASMNNNAFAKKASKEELIHNCQTGNPIACQTLKDLRGDLPDSSEPPRVNPTLSSPNFPANP
jgi:hypothetical protein